ncbi:MAG TPA: hypothetical protein VMU41_03380 [Candidatus Binataceae bacterium]|nr:hypothetical protein [Candidatus Binataceae bacterium]
MAQGDIMHELARAFLVDWVDAVKSTFKSGLGIGQCSPDFAQALNQLVQLGLFQIRIRFHDFTAEGAELKLASSMLVLQRFMNVISYGKGGKARAIIGSVRQQ